MRAMADFRTSDLIADLHRYWERLDTEQLAGRKGDPRAEQRLREMLQAARVLDACQALEEPARYVLQLGNQPGHDDDEWEQAMADLEAALSTVDAAKGAA